jgi:hypothetical protein
MSQVEAIDACRASTNGATLNCMAVNIDPWADVRAAIRQRDMRALLKLMFSTSGPELNLGFSTENELWDYKKDCPKPGKDNLGPWADLAKEVLGLHNNGWRRSGFWHFGQLQIRRREKSA